WRPGPRVVRRGRAGGGRGGGTGSAGGVMRSDVRTLLVCALRGNNLSRRCAAPGGGVTTHGAPAFGPPGQRTALRATRVSLPPYDARVTRGFPTPANDHSTITDLADAANTGGGFYVRVATSDALRTGHRRTISP